MLHTFLKTTTLAAVTATVFALSSVAGWATTIAPGATSIDVNGDYDYQHTFKTKSGAKTLTFSLTALTALILDGGANTLEISGKFKNLSVTLDGVAANLDFSGPTAKVYSFDPLAFMSGATKDLVISWSNVLKVKNKGVAQVNLQLETSPAAVPLPAGGLLLVGAIGGLAALRRRKGASAV